MQYYNVHTHIFTMENAPSEFLELYMAKVPARILKAITSTQFGSASVAFFLNTFGGQMWKRYASFLKIGKSKNQLEVFNDLMDQYDDKTIKFVALSLHMECLGAGNSDTGFEGQIEQILTVKQRYPERLLVFLGVDPRWKNGGQALQETVANYFNRKIEVSAGNYVQPFAGLKLYPSTGFYAFDERLKPTLEWAAQKNVPVLSHCNYLGGIYNNDATYIKGNLSAYDPYTRQQYIGTGWTPKLKNQELCSWFLEPNSFISLMDYFSGKTGEWKGPALKLCLAHYGGNNHIKAEAAGKPGSYYGNQPQTNWCKQIKDMMLKYPTLYTDISYALSDKDTHPAIFHDLKQATIGDRIMYGTDFFLTEREMPERDDYNTFKQHALNPQNAVNGILAWDIIASHNIADFLL